MGNDSRLPPEGIDDQSRQSTCLPAEFRHHRWLWTILFLFAVAGVVRAVPFHILTPDSGDYLIAARSLVSGNGYRDLSTEGHPAFTWRPPGLSVLLMPAAAWSFDCSTAAKGLMVLYGVGLLWGLSHFSSRLAGPNWSLLPVVFIATSPQMLVYSTEVLSEVPFTAALLGLLCLAHDWEAGQRAWWRAGLIGALLVSLPMLRTVGAPLLGVWLLWSLCAAHRRILLVPTIAAIAALVAWSFYQKSTGGSRYDSLIATVIESEGIFKFLLAGFVNLLTYLPELNHELFPGFLTDTYVEIIKDSESLPLFGTFTRSILSFSGVTVLALAATGLFWTDGSARWLCACLLAAYLAAVCLYPLRSERLLWPMVPVIWALFFAGLRAVLARAYPGRSPPMVHQFVAVAGLLALMGTQLRDWPGILRPAWRYWTDRDLFYQAPDHPRYYADWRSAAGYLHEHSRPDDAVITMLKEFYTISERRQVRLEIGRSPREIAEMIEANRVRWLAIGHGYARRAMDRLLWHPNYSFVMRYSSSSEYQVFEVLPNRSGTIPRSLLHRHGSADEQTDGSLWEHACAAFQRRDFDLTARHLRRLHEFTSLPTSYLLLARAEARRGAFDEARLCYRRMRFLESSESFAREIMDGMRELEILEELAGSEVSADRRAALGIELATLHVNWGRFDEGWELIESLIQSVPESGAVRTMAGRLLDWTGQMDAAEQAFADAARMGDHSAAELLLTRRSARALDSSIQVEVCAGTGCVIINPDDPQCALELAARWRREGLSGRALAILERFAVRFPENAEVREALFQALSDFGLQSEPSEQEQTR